MNTYGLLASYYEHIMDDLLYAIYLERITHYTSPAKTLDIGCGTGYLARTLTEQGYTVDATDTSVDILEIANHYAVLEGLKPQFFNHDMIEPFHDYYDVMIASVDVINHAKDLTAMQKAIDNMHLHLLEDGYLFIDFLKCDYITKMLGYEETIMLKDKNIKWSIQKGDSPCSFVHQIDIDGKQSSHQELSTDEEVIKTMLKAFQLIERIELEERIIYILKK